jgi:hypothetical protein
VKAQKQTVIAHNILVKQNSKTNAQIRAINIKLAAANSKYQSSIK